MSYFEAVSSSNGNNALPSNPCSLLDFSLLSLADSKSYEAASGDREVLAVIMGGKGMFGKMKMAKQLGNMDLFSGQTQF